MLPSVRLFSVVWLVLGAESLRNKAQSNWRRKARLQSSSGRSIEERLDALERENALLRSEIASIKKLSSFTLVALGDLHLDPENMGGHLSAREQIVQALDSDQAVVVSVGDLGDKHEGMKYPDGTVGQAGCTSCFHHARDYLEGFGMPFEVIAGNHDLEAMTEFQTDEENLAAWMTAFSKSEPYFRREIAHKTIILGLSTTRFRDAPLSSHEVHIDDIQLAWFEKQLRAHPASDGWKVLVFTHAPPMGSGVRALQRVHIKNGCAWLNHTSDVKRRRIFLRLVQEHSCVKAWFAGHFHLSHDYHDSLGWGLGSTSDLGGAGQNGDSTKQGQERLESLSAGQLGSQCLFVQLGVIGESSQRDGMRQTRIIRGDDKSMELWTVNHHEGGRLRHDATLFYSDMDDNVPQLIRHAIDEEIRPGGKKWFSARTPRTDDGCYLEIADEPDVRVHEFASEPSEGLAPSPTPAGSPEKVCWWHMADGKVLGVHDNMLIEYDNECLAPIGVVVEDLGSQEVVVVGGGEAVILVQPNAAGYSVLHPNEDGSYWRKFQKNKLYRTQAKMRERLAKNWWDLQQAEVSYKFDAEAKVD